MDDARKLEIATRLLRYIGYTKGITIGQEFTRVLGNAAKAIDVPIDELKQFIAPIMQDILGCCFPASNSGQGEA